VKEIRSRLSGYGFSERTVKRVVADFLRVGLLDDRAFAEAYVRSRMAQRPMGRRLLQQELLHRGVGEETAAEAVGRAYVAVPEADLARELVRKKIRAGGGGDSRRVRQKLADMLGRRGFDWDVIASVIQETEWESDG
jgi:regulatory protein